MIQTVIAIGMFQIMSHVWLFATDVFYHLMFYPQAIAVGVFQTKLIIAYNSDNQWNWCFSNNVSQLIAIDVFYHLMLYPWAIALDVFQTKLIYELFMTFLRLVTKIQDCLRP